jgi:hypothetical protein
MLLLLRAEKSDNLTLWGLRKGGRGAPWCCRDAAGDGRGWSQGQGRQCRQHGSRHRGCSTCAGAGRSTMMPKTMMRQQRYQARPRGVAGQPAG